MALLGNVQVELELRQTVKRPCEIIRSSQVVPKYFWKKTSRPPSLISAILCPPPSSLSRHSHLKMNLYEFNTADLKCYSFWNESENVKHEPRATPDHQRLVSCSPALVVLVGLWLREDDDAFFSMHLSQERAACLGWFPLEKKSVLI